MSGDSRLGSVIGGCRLDAVLGRGGMGIVYLAHQLTLERKVALKLISGEFAQDFAFRERFQRESRVAASIEHPNVVTVHEAGEDAGLLYLIMRYVPGTDLRAMILEDGRLHPERAAGVMQQVGGALDAAHGLGLVHRDVKPANILIGAGAGEDRCYLADFGLTKLAAATGGLTNTGQWVGTLDYVAPEQIQGARIDARADVYALGCVLYQVLTGCVPFAKDSEVAKMWAHIGEPPPSPRAADPSLAPAFDAVIGRALAKDPDDRFPSAGDLGRAAAAAAAGTTVTQPERSVATGAASPATTVASSREEPARPQPVTTASTRSFPRPAPRPDVAPPPGAPPRRPQGRRAVIPLIAGAAVLLIAGAAAAILLMRSSGASRPSGLAGRTVSAQLTTPPRRTAPTSPTAPQPSDRGSTQTSTMGANVPSSPSSTTSTYQADTYAVRRQSDWTVASDNQPTRGYFETEFRSPDGQSFVRIDHIPGETADPATKAGQVESATRSSAGYQRIAFETVSLAGRPGFEWIFKIRDSASPEKVDFFTNTGSDGYAILGGGPAFGPALSAARRVAESLTAR